MLGNPEMSSLIPTRISGNAGCSRAKGDAAARNCINIVRAAT